MATWRLPRCAGATGGGPVCLRAGVPVASALGAPRRRRVRGARNGPPGDCLRFRLAPAPVHWTRLLGAGRTIENEKEKRKIDERKRRKKKVESKAYFPLANAHHLSAKFPCDFCLAPNA
eukprot:scaffold13857_cov107-Isochrysis_galbana.AAC.5